MTQLDLGRADLALFSDPIGSRVHIPSLMSLTRDRASEGVVVRFDGDTYGTGFRGEGKTAALNLTCRYARKNAHLRIALEHLLDELAPAQFDSRLLLRLHVDVADARLTAPLQAFLARSNVVAVQVFGFQVVSAGYALDDLSFSAQVVNHRFGTTA